MSAPALPGPATLTPFTGYQSRTIHGTTERARMGVKVWTLCGRRLDVREVRTAGWDAIVNNRWSVLCRTCLSVSGSTLPPEAPTCTR